MIRSVSLLAGALALAACSQTSPADQPADPSMQGAPSDTATTASEQACAPVQLEISEDRFGPGRENFAEGTVGRTRLSDNFAQAYAEACAEGWLARKPLVDARSDGSGILYIANAPHSNQATILSDGSSTVMEGPFFSASGHVQLPGAAAIKEAIYCHSVGATPEEMENGRCLPD